MLKDKYLIWNKEEYNYPRAFGFIPNLMSYIHEDEVERPCMIVIPGGSYCMAVPTEGEVVALEFYERGYNTFVLTYTTNRLFDIPLKLQPLKDVSRAIRFVRKNKESFHIKEDQLVVCGFSAGGHLAGSICVHYNDVEDENEEYKRISNRPDAGILSYPVITMGEYKEPATKEALLGPNPTEEEECYMSLEKQVTKDTSPCFIWQTVTDELVSVENSYLFAAGMRKAGVTYCHHVFSRGNHGLSVANEKWMKGEFGELYTFEQMQRICDAYLKGEFELTEKQISEIVPKELQPKKDEEKIDTTSNQTVSKQTQDVSESVQKEVDTPFVIDLKAVEEAKVWPSLAETFLNHLWNKDNE